METSKKTKILYTICIFLNHFAFGITSNALWPTLVDLSRIYKVSSEKINFISTFGSLGYLIGSLSGIIYKWVNRQLFLIGIVICLAVTMALVPFYTYVPLLFAAMTLNGIGGGSWDSSNNVWLVEMWPEKHASVMQSSQFMYGLGLIVSPTLVSPFVHGKEEDSNNTVSINGADSIDNSTDISPEELKSSLTVPFSIVGSIQSIVPVILLLLYFIKPYKRPENSGINSPVEEDVMAMRTQSSTLFWKIKVFIVALVLASYDAAELGYFYYSPTMFQYIKLELSASEAAHVLSVLSASYTFGRLLTAFISLKLKPDIIISYHFVIIIIAQLGLYLGIHNKTFIYLCTVLLGFGFSAMWPAILAFTERHFKLSDKVGSLLFFFAGLVSIFTPFLIGDITDSPLVLLQFQAVYLSISLVLFIIVNILLHIF